ncbi:MAG: hypothetical protein WB774_13060 [Xanthobacteraceae bacterium]
MQIGRNRSQHEAKNEQIKSVHRIADGGCRKRLLGEGADMIGGFGQVGMDSGHRRLLRSRLI